MVIVGDRHKGDELLRIHFSNGTFFVGMYSYYETTCTKIILPYFDVGISSHLILVSTPHYVPLIMGDRHSNFGANVVRAHERFPCGGRRSGH